MRNVSILRNAKQIYQIFQACTSDTGRVPNRKLRRLDALEVELVVRILFHYYQRCLDCLTEALMLRGL